MARRIAHPSFEPVTLERLREHVRLDDALSDDLLRGYISAAREMAEDGLQRAICATTWETVADAFAPGIELPRPIIQAIESVQYLDDAGTLRTLDPQDFVFDGASDLRPGWLVPAWGRTWPVVRTHVNAVRVRYRAGWETPEAVPWVIRQWVLMQAAELCKHAEVTTALQPHPLGYVDRLIDAWRVY